MMRDKDRKSYWWLLLAILVSSLSGLSCGVKGMPLPPLEPPAIGRGAPSYKDTAIEAKPDASSMTPVPSPTPTAVQEGRE